MPSIYEYLNYRTFLQDFFLEQKELNRSLTHRVMLKEMGITSTGFLSNVINGRKNFNGTHIVKMAKILKLARREQRYFEYMVYYTQAKSIEEKKEYLDRLMSMRKLRITQIQENQLDLFSQWYYVYIRDLLIFIDFKDDYKTLSQMLDPPIKPQEAEQAISDLVAMGLIAKDTIGYYRPTEKIITTGDEVRSVQLGNFQLKTMDMAKRALEKFEAAERDISIASMTLSSDGFKRVKSEVQAFRKKLLQIAHEETSPDRVFQCNIQLFPVTKKQNGDI